MNYEAIYSLLSAIQHALTDPDQIAAIQLGTPSVLIPHPAGIEFDNLTVELGVTQKMENFTVLIKTSTGVQVMALGVFGHRALTDDVLEAGMCFHLSAEDLTFHTHLGRQERQMELIWMKCLRVFYEKGFQDYKNRPAYNQPEVVEFCKYLGGSA